jgi:FKBP-type peptidyl-prolyl cis-trans isomerase FklB
MGEITYFRSLNRSVFSRITFFMKKFPLLVSCALTLVFPLAAQSQKPTPKPAPKPPVKSAPAPVVTLRTELDSLSYAYGLMTGRQFRSMNLQSVSGTLFGQAIDDALKGRKGALDETQAEAFMQAFSRKMYERQQQENARKYEPNKKAGEAFLAANKTKDSVVTLPSGLQYKILRKGDGPKPTLNDKVKTHYHGTLIDGTVFDSSVQRGEPISFAVGGVIPGWVEALQLMPVGSKWRLFVPYQLAYGERGSPPAIPPYSALIFDVELLGIEK